MHASSRSVTSNQFAPHDDLARRVTRALNHPLRKPVAEHTRRAFAEARRWVADQSRPLVLDAGCGVGLSTRQLAGIHAEHAVIGIDRTGHTWEQVVTDYTFLNSSAMRKWWYSNTPPAGKPFPNYPGAEA